MKTSDVLEEQADDGDDFYWWTLSQGMQSTGQLEDGSSKQQRSRFFEFPPRRTPIYPGVPQYVRHGSGGAGLVLELYWKLGLFPKHQHYAKPYDLNRFHNEYGWLLPCLLCEAMGFYSGNKLCLKVQHDGPAFCCFNYDASWVKHSAKDLVSFLYNEIRVLEEWQSLSPTNQSYEDLIEQRKQSGEWLGQNVKLSHDID